MKRKNKKLVVLVSAFSQGKNDSGDFTLDLSYGLSQNDFDVTVVCPHHRGLKFKEKIKGLKVKRFVYFYPYFWQKLAYGGGIPYNMKKSLLAKLQVPFFILAELLAAIKVIKEEKPAIIQSHWLIPQGLVGAFCQRYFRVPHLATIHSSEVTVLKSLPFGRKMAEFILKNSTKIVSVSRHRLDELLDFVSPKLTLQIRNKTEIIPMGVDLADFRKKSGKRVPQNAPVLLFVGRLVEVKGCEYLVKAMAEVKKKYKDAKLIMVGDGPLRHDLVLLAEKLKVTKNIDFTGLVDHALIGQYYREADFVVFPSIVDRSGYQEGLPVVLIEAMASGKAVVASRIKGAEEIITDGINGALVKPKDSAALAKKIMDLYQSGDYRQLEAAALKSSHAYNWSTISRRYSKALKNALQLN